MKFIWYHKRAFTVQALLSASDGGGPGGTPRQRSRSGWAGDMFSAELQCAEGAGFRTITVDAAQVTQPGIDGGLASSDHRIGGLPSLISRLEPAGMSRWTL